MLLAIGENDWLHGEAKVLRNGKKVVDFESEGEHKRSSRQEKAVTETQAKRIFAETKKNG